MKPGQSPSMSNQPGGMASSSSSQRIVLGGASSAKAEKALLDKLRAFQKADIENRRCVDCGDSGPTYICMDYGSFICTTCSGLHREFNHKVKGVSMSKWTPEEVDFILSRGNTKVKETYMKHYKEDVPQPEPGQLQRLRHWLRYKYLDRRWADQPEPAPPSSPPTTMKSTSSTSTHPLKRHSTTESKSSKKTSAPSSPTTTSPRKSSSRRHHHHHTPKTKTSEASGMDLLGLGDTSDPFAAPPPPLQPTSAPAQSSASTSFFTDFPPVPQSTPASSSTHFSNVRSNPFDSMPTTTSQQHQTHQPFPQHHPPQSAPPSTSIDPFAAFAAAPVSVSAPPSSIQQRPIPSSITAPAFPSSSIPPTASPSFDGLSNAFSPPPTSGAFQVSMTTSMSHPSSPIMTQPAVAPKPTEHLAGHLAKSLTASQRYQGDPFADISLDYVAEPRPIDGEQETQQVVIPTTEPPTSFRPVVLSPSMTLKSPQHSDPSASQQNQSLDILTKQVAALKDALQESHITPTVITATGPSSQSQDSQRRSSGCSFTTDPFGGMDDFGASGIIGASSFSAHSSKPSSPLAQNSFNTTFQQQQQQQQHLPTTQSTTAMTSTFSIDFRANGQITPPLASHDDHNTSDVGLNGDVHNALDAAAGSVLDSFPSPSPTSPWASEFKPVEGGANQSVDWAEFDSVPPFAEGASSCGGSKGAANPFHVF